MTEYEKSQRGLPHIFDAPMVAMYDRAATLSTAYNRTDLQNVQKLNELLDALLKSKGDEVRIMPDFHCEYGSNITIGHRVFINFNCILMDNAEIVIGDDVRIGPNVSVYTVNHALDPDERATGLCVCAPVYVANKVWIGGDVTILAGVMIGEGAVIGAGSVVTKDVPAGMIAAGNPCRVIRPIRAEDKLIHR
ncbi:MAG: sugar O-acetyltransferase [Eubacteriales bacterium]|nr:sugar O-acetyltransferase [Eubacteriales bacterium]